MSLLFNRNQSPLHVFKLSLGYSFELWFKGVSVYVFRQPSKPIFKTTESRNSLEQSLDRQFSLCCCLFIYTEKGMNTTPEIWSTWLILILGRAWERGGVLTSLGWSSWMFGPIGMRFQRHQIILFTLRLLFHWRFFSLGLLLNFQFSSSFSDLHCLFRMPVLFFFFKFFRLFPNLLFFLSELHQESKRPGSKWMPFYFLGKSTLLSHKQYLLSAYYMC